MSDPRFVFYSALGIIAGGLLAIQSVLNAALAQRTGTLASMVILTLIGAAVLLLILALTPSSIDLRSLPRLPEAYLYVGALLGLVILATPLVLVPRIGAASTLIAIVLGQLLLALLIDHFGFLHATRIPVSLPRLIGVVMAGAGAFLVLR